ncbi:hypothetical protein [Acidianus sp. HS-5]|uniref:hypothetical protein n=1 Tax=Acidianus sp. HS-5 TaxID=2886040 RepID=UPI001F40A805|nr:hypothetical protein [Acidianus sp. HS-5]
MKDVIIRTKLSCNYRKLKAFFMSSGLVKLFYYVNKIDKTGPYEYVINDKYHAELFIFDKKIMWEVYKDKDLKDRIEVELIPLTDNDTALFLKFSTNRILPLKRILEKEVNSEVDLLRELLDSLKAFNLAQQ